MTPEELAARIDHTLLRPTATANEIKRLCEEAVRFGFASVCVPPTFVPLAREKLKGRKPRVSTVVGFPLGFEMTSVKVYAAREAFFAGARELDVVINLAWVKEGRFDFIAGEIESICEAVPEATIKVIIECAYLSQEEKVAVIEALREGRAHYIKTSTGFASQGATVEDVKLIHDLTLGMKKVKAAGGIRTLPQALELIRAGADRLGTSAGVQIMNEALSPS
ncbi:deoxyribose-phosphate aldolase [Thermosulfuriphilus ammonigenes]|uniref:Deoxyribose-phosphate aldolase n=1 Tax=Thermosulfuriphilus ammonigenes TaxID=1936021 RepID=A0A6G7PTJ0_9BACT|nr:deoxyribose-phosphate aldolase [Thermosulfuriphilus ammonigenes]MBA2848979.1 deoxyribose-phosphate aldolase [Thermosulfuriphilus ammonigenes]QIJ70907.1 deoxyribose-phosphate aldolase [Thermosulfuriphilus ammonigenes]